MHIGPIFRALMHNKSRFWLITLEVALTLAIAVNCINMMVDMRHDLIKPSGYDEENIIVVSTEPFAASFKEEDFVDTVRQEDLRQLLAHPSIRAATGIQQIPLSGSGSATGRKPLGSETEPVSTPYYVVTEGALEAFGVELVAGRDFAPGDWDYDEEAAESGEEARNVILSQALADRLFPDGDAVGRSIESKEGERMNTIVGVVDTMLCSWPTSEIAEYVMLFAGKPGSGRRLQYMVRVEPGAVDAVYADVEEIVRGVNPDRVITVRTLTEIKLENFQATLGVMKMLSTVIVLLLVVTALGIVGLTSFSVTERTRQIGTRRALGASKGDIVRYFLVENWMITGFGLLFGLLLTYGLNYILVSLANGAKLDLTLVIAGSILLWLTGILAALVPAVRATSVAPEVATRTV
jgi:putative ABC transport system permease protein